MIPKNADPLMSPSGRVTEHGFPGDYGKVWLAMHASNSSMQKRFMNSPIVAYSLQSGLKVGEICTQLQNETKRGS